MGAMKKQSRVPGRLLIFISLLLRLPFQLFRRRPADAEVRRILVLHHLLLGDCMMTTALLAKLRERYPNAELVMAMPKLVAPLYAGRPYGVEPLGWNPRDFASIKQLFALPPFALVYRPGENRLSYLARAIGARWIVGFAGEYPAYKNVFVDEMRLYSSEPTAWCDTVAELVDGPRPKPYQSSDWPFMEETLPLLPERFAVLHVGASSATKYWPTSRWEAVAAYLRTSGLAIVWSCGPGEAALLEEIRQQPDDLAIFGSMSLPQMRSLLARAQVGVCPDSGISHLMRVVGIPSITLYGPASALLVGPGYFFSQVGNKAAGLTVFPCRNQSVMFYRHVDWAHRCGRAVGAFEQGKCPHSQCMNAIMVEDVLNLLASIPVVRG